MADSSELTHAALVAGCATEPIHAPGAVQPHGVLLGADHHGTIRVASENVETILGRPAAAALGRDLAEVVGEHAVHRLAEVVDGEVVSLDLDGGRYDAVIHRSDPFDLIEIEPAAVDLLDTPSLLPRALLRFHGATSSGELLGQAAATVQDLTGFDRVMVYRFDADWNGEVVAEVVRPDLEPFLGLRYPASDIPPQARALYSRMRLRLIPDVSADPSPLLASDEGSAQTLDLSEVAIRAVAPVHLRYLANMGVRASMSVAVHVGDRLWGLIACHHLDGPLRPSLQTRAAVDLVGRTTSTVLAALLSAESTATQLALRQRLDAIVEPLLLDGASDVGAALVAAPDGQLRALLDAESAAVITGRSTLLSGTGPPTELIGRLIALLSASGQDLLASDQLTTLDEAWADHRSTAAGALVVRVGSGDRWLAWFRPETAALIRWGGDPNGKEAAVDDRGQLQLTPRSSFAEYLEHVHGVSEPWSEEHVATARLAAARLAELEALKVQRDASIASALQRAVMIEAFPAVPGLDGAAHYRPGAQDPIGGDWYDVFFRPRGGPVLALGDVAGHGLSAASTMAQLRHALRAYVVRERDLPEAMARLNDLLRTLLPGDMATAVMVSLDPDARTADIINAGHLPPVVTGPDGARLVEGDHHDPALGIRPDASYATTRVHLAPGETLVLYTDGLIEQRTTAMDDRLATLLEVAGAGAHLDAAALCDSLVVALAEGGDLDDDTTVLAVSFTDP